MAATLPSFCYDGGVTAFTAGKTMNFKGYGRATVLAMLLWGQAGVAQHAMHNMGSGSEELPLQTMPANDEVLSTAPGQLMLHFGVDVRLVKFVLRNSENEFFDLGFRYQPKAGRDYIQPVPPLVADDYYRVEWGAIDSNGKLVRGMFHFSFGPDARPPSYWLDQQEQMQHIMSPDYRLLQVQ